MQEPIAKVCSVEPADGVVLIECGNAAATLTAAAARDFPQKLTDAADASHAGSGATG